MKYALMVRNDDLSKKTALKIKESLQNFFIYDEKNEDEIVILLAEFILYNGYR